MAAGNDTSGDQVVAAINHAAINHAAINHKEVITTMHTEHGVKARARAPPAVDRVTQPHMGRYLPSNKITTPQTQL